MKIIRGTLGVLVAVAAVGAALYLLCAGPDDLEAWSPPAAPAPSKVAVVAGQVVGEGLCEAPRNVAVDAAGRVYALCREGEIVVLAANASTASTLLARVKHGLGIAFGPLGGMVVAGSAEGLFHVGGRAVADALVAAKDAPAPQLVSAVDDFKLTPEVLYVDASDRPGRPEPARALLEHAGTGTLYRYDLRTHESTLLLGGLQTPLAVAIGPDDRYALVAETGAYRILRYWLTGPQAGTHEVFLDQLPGFVTSIAYNRGDRFWAAIETGRHPVFDRLAAHPRVRAALSTLPWSWLPMADDSRVIGFDLEGKVTTGFRLKPQPGSGRITSVVEHGPWLWIGSDAADALVRVPLQAVVAAAPPPPAGWNTAPRRPQALSVKPPEDDD